MKKSITWLLIIFWLALYTPCGDVAYGEGKESDELITKLKNAEVGYMAYGTLRSFGTNLWELIVETNLFKDGEGKKMEPKLNVDGNKVSLKLTTETGVMVFNFQIQDGIATLGSSTVNRETIDAMSALMILSSLSEDLKTSNPTEDEMEKARVAARGMLSSGFETGESQVGTAVLLWFVCGFLGMLIGIKRGLKLIPAFFAGALLGYLFPLMFLVSGTKRCPKCAERINRKAKVCKHCGHEF